MSSQSYDKPLVVTYQLGGEFDFGAGGDSFSIPVPTGKVACRIESIAFSATSEAVANDTSTESVEIGTAADTDKFASFLIPDGTADTDSVASDADDLVDNGYGGAGIVNVGSEGENISQLEVTYVQHTDSGTAAGIGYVHITIGWW